MKVYLAFETTVDTVTGIYVQTGMYGKTETLAEPISRTDSKISHNFPLITFRQLVLFLCQLRKLL